MNKKMVVLAALVMMAMVLALVSCSGGGGGSPAPSSPSTPGGGDNTTPGGGNNTTTGGGSGSTIRLSGQVAVGSSQLAAAGLKPDKTAGAASIRFATAAANPFASANVSLLKMFANGTKEVVAGVSAVTDALGNYTLDNVPAVQTGTGAATDFYYEVQAAAGSIEVSAPAAPTANATVNVSPETKIAAAMISDVARVPGVTAAQVLPSDKVIDLLRDVVQANVNQMSAFTLPSMAPGAEAKVLIAASAVSSNNGDAEKLLRAYESLKEALYLQQNRSTVTETRIAGYLDRATRAACNFRGSRLNQAASSALAAAFKNGTTYTPVQIAAAYNEARGNDPAIDANGLVSAYNSSLSSLSTAISTSAAIPDSAIMGIYASRGDLRSISTGSALQADQALIVLQMAKQQPNNQPQPNQQQPPQVCQAPLDYMKIIAALTGNTALVTTPSFADVEVYHSRMQCAEGTLEAKVNIYTPQGVTVSGVTISASGMTNQQAQPVASLNFSPHNLPNVSPSSGTSTWVSEQACLAFNQTYNFTITATLSSGGPLTTQVSRTIVNVPEARITLMAKDYAETAVFFQPGTGQPNNPIKLTAAQSTKRPLFKWAPKPGDAQTGAQLHTAPEGSQIKYLFDVSHFSISQGGPENGNAVACPVFQNNDKYFEKDYLISPIDCDVDTCNAATGTQHVCRIHVQTVLVDEFDRTLGWAAGGDMYYCLEGQENCQ